MNILQKKLIIVFLGIFPILNCNAQCPDITWKALNITNITGNEVYYSYELQNIGSDTVFRKDIILQNYHSDDGISGDLAAGGMYIDFNSVKYLLPGEELQGNYQASHTVDLINYPYLMVEIYNLIDECNTANNWISKKIALDTAVQAGFTVNVTSDTIPLEVQFTDTSTSNPTHWEWDFDNDGTIDSYEQNPVKIYTVPGIYSVKLKASKAGFIDSTSKAGLILAYPTLSADLSANKTSGTIKLAVLFSDESIGKPIHWQWDFNNDGIIDDTISNPTYTYENPGIYSVKLVVSDEYMTDSIIKADFIAITDTLIANFTADITEGYNPLTIHFIDKSIGSPISWKWDFNNDGGVDDTIQNPVWVFRTAGKYSVRLMVSKTMFADTLLKTDYIVVNNRPVNELNNLTEDIWSLFPNPAVETITISGGFINNVLIIDITGKPVLNINSVEKDAVRIDISTLEPGLYLAKIDSSGSKYILKFCKNRY